MKELALSVAEIKEIVDSFSRGKLGALKLSQGDFCLELEGGRTEQIVVQAAAADGVQAAVAQQTIQSPQQPQLTGHVVTSPIVGTFYAAPAPDKKPYVQVGSAVKKGDVLFIIESMKLMNEVASDIDGTVTEILVEDAQAVEFGQPILCIE